MPDLDPAAVRERCKKATEAAIVVLRDGPVGIGDDGLIFRDEARVIAEDIIKSSGIAASLDREAALLAEVERLREQMVGWMNRYEADAARELTAERDALQASLDAVLALCDEAEALTVKYRSHDLDPSRDTTVGTDEVRAAAESRPLPHNEAETRESGATT